MKLFSPRLVSRSQSCIGALLGLLVCVLVPSILLADAPVWWAERGVLTVGATPDDYAAANQGQVKNIAKQAYEEMKTKLPGGAGSMLSSIWETPAASSDDYRAVNLGQLKNVAEPFYARLEELNYTGQPLASGQTRPWSGQADDYALANIGQVKNVFSFQILSLPEAPANLVVTPTTATTADLTWSVGSATVPIVQVSTDNGVTWRTLAVLPAGTTQYTATDLDASASNSFRVVKSANGSVSPQMVDWMQANGLDPVTSLLDDDSDGDGLTNLEESVRGTKPDDMDGDTDNDGVSDLDDGWPLHAWITTQRLPDVRYAVVRLRALGWPANRAAQALDDNGGVLGTESGVATPYYFRPGIDLATGGVAVPITSAGGNYSARLSKDGLVFAGESAGQAPYLHKAKAWRLGDTDATSYETQETFSGMTTTDIQTAVTGSANGRTVVVEQGFVYRTSPSQNGSYASVRIYSGETSTLLGQRVERIWAGGTSTDTGSSFAPVLINHDGILAGYPFTPADLGQLDAAGPASIWENGQVTNFSGIAVALPDSTPRVFIGAAPLDEYDIDNTRVYWAHKQDSAWVSEDLKAWDSLTYQKRYPWSGALRANARLEMISGSELIRNGQFVSPASYTPAGWSDVYFNDINNHGVILAQATRTLDDQGLPITNLQSEPVLLVPAGFVTSHPRSNTGRRPLGSFSDIAAGPRVTLNEITLADIAISNGMASVTVAGEIIDVPMGTIPPGLGGDITEVIVFINGQETHLRSTVARASQAATFWAPYVDKGVITPFTISFPARDVATVEIVTAPNALGLRGSAGFDVIFQETTPQPGFHPAMSYSADLIFPSSLSTTVADTLLLTAPDAVTGETLVESGPNTGVFANALKTASFILCNVGFSQGGPVIGPIQGSLRGSAELPAGSGVGQDGPDEGVETASGSHRYRFTVSRVAQPLPRNPSWQLHEVSMLPPETGSPAGPIGFAAAPFETVKLNFLGQDFAIEKIAGHPDQNTAFGVTAEGKPVLGFVAVREEDPEVEKPTLVREFVYYDHTAQALVRHPLAYEAGNAQWALKLGATNPVTLPQKTPAQTIRLVDDAGLDRPGFLPVEIDNLLAFLDGEPGVEISPEAVFRLELTGYAPGEVVRLFSTEATDDHFDVIIPGADPLLTPHPVKNAILAESTSGVYRTTERVVIYSTPDDPSLRIDPSDWADLKALGYLAIHNEDIIIKTGEDMARWLAQNPQISMHPAANAILGVTAHAGSKDATLYRFAGFDDHHVFNKFHDNEIKAARWNKIFDKGWKNIFGEDFDVDEFTVPVHARTHKKMGKAITGKWETFLEEFFDEAGELKPGVDIAQLRKSTMDKMYAICDEFKIDTSKMRIWPGILDAPGKSSETLVQRIVTSQGKLGSSLNKLTRIKQLSYDLTTQSGRAAFRQTTKREIKAVAGRAGKKGAIQLLPMASLALTATTVVITTVDFTTQGWEEALAQGINDELGLEDIELAREFVNAKFAGSYIAGGTPRLSIPVNSSKNILLGQRIYKVSYDNDGRANSILAYTVVELKVFPEGKRTVALAREDCVTQVEYMDNPRWVIDNYWPKRGDPETLHREALRDAMWLQ